MTLAAFLPLQLFLVLKAVSTAEAGETLRPQVRPQAAVTKSRVQVGHLKLSLSITAVAGGEVVGSHVKCHPANTR